MIDGIDVSKWQSALDWPKVKASGVALMLARASVGLVGDAMYGSHVPNARRAGLEVGAYHYLWPLVDPAKAVAAFLHYAGDVPKYALDVEQDGLTTSMVRAWVAEFRKQRPAATLFVYISPGFWSKLGRPNLSDLGLLWLADWRAYTGWPPATGGWSAATLWQYGSRSIPGASVDGNRFRGTLDEYRALSLPDTSTGATPMAEFIAAGGLDLSSTWCIDLPAGTNLYADEATVKQTLGKSATVDYLGQSSGFYFVGVDSGAFYADGGLRRTQVMIKPTEFAARPRVKTAAELQTTAARYAAQVTVTIPPDATACQPFSDAARADGYAAGTAFGIAKGTKDENERIALAEAARIRGL